MTRRWLEVHGGVQGDAADNSYVWTPSIKTEAQLDIILQLGADAAFPAK